MTNPMTLRIGARTYVVRAMTDDEYSHQPSVGATHSDRGCIALYPRVPPDHQAETLVHEIVHAVADAYGLTWPAEEERVARVVGAGFAQVIRDNPSLLRALDAAQHHGKSIVKPS